MQNGRINVPMNVPIIGQQQQELEFKPKWLHVKQAPFAQPVAVILPTKDGPVPVVYGGLTALEAMAAQIAAGLAHEYEPRHVYDENDSQHNAQILKGVASRAVDLAVAIIAECDRRTQPQQQESS